jgi:hypothetical protein
MKDKWSDVHKHEVRTELKSSAELLEELRKQIIDLQADGYLKGVVVPALLPPKGDSSGYGLAPSLSMWAECKLDVKAMHHERQQEPQYMAAISGERANDERVKCLRIFADGNGETWKTST